MLLYSTVDMNETLEAGPTSAAFAFVFPWLPSLLQQLQEENLTVLISYSSSSTRNISYCLSNTLAKQSSIISWSADT
jgi:hypothetical protein